MNDRITIYRDKYIKDMDKKELINIINELATNNKILNEEIIHLRIKAIEKGTIL